MDWPLFALISYGFLLVLIIVLIILRSSRSVRSRYARVLEEKETKLARMQIDLEESMEALDAYAEQLRLEWKKFEKDDKEGLNRLYKKEIDLEASFLALRARVTAIEIELKRQKQASSAQSLFAGTEQAVAPAAVKVAMRQELPELTVHEPDAAAVLPPLDASEPTPAYAPMEQAHPKVRHFPAPPEPEISAPAVIEGEQAAPPVAATDGLAPPPVATADGLAPPPVATTDGLAPDKEPPREHADVQRRAKTLLEAGEDAAAISRSLNISRTETSLLLKSLILAKAREQTGDARSSALEALERGESRAEVARRFDLSHTEVALLAASNLDVRGEKSRNI